MQQDTGLRFPLWKPVIAFWKSICEKELIESSQ